MSLIDRDPHVIPPAALVADGVRLAIIRALAERIDASSPVALDDALASVRERLRQDGRDIELARATAHRHRDLARAIASLADVDRELAEEMFAPSRAQLVIEALRDHRIGGAR